ncbi:protection of telomeres protein 1b-like [Cannabis sativa]|uniref:protection of telomeres protein 1b-like n=1 Tax=Cannabis sativa TaxID=3483 RepID=UPI0029CA03B7|nr:protection of telomeres protein 1b-like [Cannabis sativa]
MFAKHFRMLPHVTSFGDIIQLSNVMVLLCLYFMKTHGGEVYVVFNKKSSTFAVYDGNDNERLLPYQTYPIIIQRDVGKKLNNPLPLQPEQLHLSRDILGTFPTLETVLRVVFDQGTKKHGLHLLHIGKWMKFINVYCDVNGGFWRGSFTPSTKFRYTHDKHRLILERQRLHAFTKTVTYDMSRLIVPHKVKYKDLPVVTLMDVHTYPENKLFWQSTPIDVLTRKRNALLRVTTNDDGKQVEDGIAKNPPWLQCCLKSYSLDKSNI